MSRMLARFLSSRRPRPQARTFRPALETLEDRTVLSPVFLVAPNQAVDSAHVANLNTAIKNAGSGGTVQVEPGAIGGSFTLQQTNTPFNASGITIQGDPNVAASSLPLLNISFTTSGIGAGTSLAASGVTLQNLNLGLVAIGAGANGERILNSVANSITIDGGANPTAANNGNNVIEGNTIGLVLIGSGTTYSANDQVLYNTFNTSGSPSAPTGIGAFNDAGVVIKGNSLTFTPELFLFGSSILVVDSQSADIEANNINVNPDTSAVTTAIPPYSTIGINVVWTGAFPAGAAKGAVVQLNTVNTNNVTGGVGLVIDASGTDTDANVQVSVQGNDFHNNQVGAVYMARNDGSSFGATFGGPAQTGSATSLGGNDFRGTNVAIAVTTPTGAALVNAGAVLFAQNNIFINFTATPNVIVPSNGTATGTINTSNPLNSNQAFVQKLYEQVLGTVVDVSQLTGWVNILTSTSNTGAARQLVATLFQYSTAGLGHLVDQLSQLLVGHPFSSAQRSLFISELRSGIRSVVGDIIASPDYYTATGGNVLNTAFQQLTGMIANPQISQGLQLAQFQLGANGQVNGVNGVVQQILQTSQGRTQAVDVLFQEFFHRAPTANELSFNVYYGGSLFNIELGLLASQEFLNFG